MPQADEKQVGDSLRHKTLGHVLHPDKTSTVPDSELASRISQEPRDGWNPHRSGSMQIRIGDATCTLEHGKSPSLEFDQSRNSADKVSKGMCQPKRLGSVPLISGGEFLEVILYADREQAIQDSDELPEAKRGVGGLRNNYLSCMV